MRRIAVLISSVALLLATGCSSDGFFPAGTTTQAVLTSNNFRVVMTNVKGGDAGFKVFGIGNNAHMYVCLEKIRVQAQLEDRSRALVNVTVDDSWWTLGIVSGDSLTVTADVIEYTGPPIGTE